MSDKISAKDLEDGKILSNLKLSFLGEPTQEMLFPLLCCLRESVVKVPFIAKMSDADKERLANVKEGESFSNKDEIALTADLLKAEDGKKFFPIFSNDDAMDDEYKTRFTIVPVTFEDCVKMAHSDSEVSGLVLDGFTSPFVIPFDLADYTLQIPSTISHDD